MEHLSRQTNLLFPKLLGRRRGDLPSRRDLGVIYRCVSCSAEVNEENISSSFVCVSQVAEQLMTIAYDSGVNLFDTAEVYSGGK